MSVGCCPGCKRRLDSILIERLSPEVQEPDASAVWPVGLAFVCPLPDCHTIISIVESLPGAQTRRADHQPRRPLAS